LPACAHRQRQGHLRNKEHLEHPLTAPLAGRLPELSTAARWKAGPRPTLSMPRLCSFVEQITLPLTNSGCRKGRVICETKSIWSILLLLRLREGFPNFPPPPLEGRASPYTIDAATMQLCGADHPASHHPTPLRPECSRAQLPRLTPYDRTRETARARPPSPRRRPGNGLGGPFSDTSGRSPPWRPACSAQGSVAAQVPG
jgi:hypothetical protein